MDKSEELTRQEELQIMLPEVANKMSEADKDEVMRDDLRSQRLFKCFDLINRGQAWYNTLTDEQKQELQAWYEQWLDVTKALVVPNKPSWLV